MLHWTVWGPHWMPQLQGSMIQGQWKATQIFWLYPCHTSVTSYVGELYTCKEDALSGKSCTWAWHYQGCFWWFPLSVFTQHHCPRWWGQSLFLLFQWTDECDIALGLSMDGFAPFKKHNKTCWPIILFNHNLPPENCFQKKYCIHVATVLGPKKPWDWDSFCWPLVQELIQLELGVKAFDAINQALFLLQPILSWHLVTFLLWLWSCAWRGKMVSDLVEYATSKVFTSILAQTMSPCDETRFLELHLLNMTHLIFPSALMRN